MTRKLQVASEFLGYFRQWDGYDSLPDGEHYTVFRVRCEDIFHTEVIHCIGKLPIPSAEAERMYLDKLRRHSEREARMVYRMIVRVREIETGYAKRT